MPKPTTTRYRVTAAAASAQIDGPDGSMVHFFYRGAILPATTNPNAIKHLLSLEMIKPFEVAA